MIKEFLNNAAEEKLFVPTPVPEKESYTKEEVQAMINNEIENHKKYIVKNFNDPINAEIEKLKGATIGTAKLSEENKELHNVLLSLKKDNEVLQNFMKTYQENESKSKAATLLKGLVATGAEYDVYQRIPNVKEIENDPASLLKAVEEITSQLTYLKAQALPNEQKSAQSTIQQPLFYKPRPKVEGGRKY